MSFLQKIIGYVSGNGWEIDSNNNGKVNLPTVLSQPGFAGVAGQADDGTITGTREMLPAYVSRSNRLAIGQTQFLWDDTFNATAQNTAKYRAPATTMTTAQASGVLILNNSGITTINTNCAYQTYRCFPLFTTAETRINFAAMFASANAHVANNAIEIGCFTATLPGGAAPTDGAFFRWNAANELRGVVNYNGTETQTAAITKPSNDVNHDYLIVAQTNVVAFYIDGVMRAKITLVTDAPALGQPFMQATQPLTMRHYIGGSAPASVTKIQISDVWVTLLGPDAGRSWESIKAGMGHGATQGQNGGTMGSTALYTNSLAPGAGAAMTNTTAALGAGLGGQFTAQPTLAANTDGILCSYQNPVGGLTQTPRNLVIKGVWLKGICSAAITGGPLLFLYSLAYGHTAVSMVTAEAATTKAPRRVALGQETFVVTTPVGTLGQGVYVKFDVPLVVAPGEFVAICAKNIGTVSSAGTICWLVGFDAYNE